MTFKSRAALVEDVNRQFPLYSVEATSRGFSLDVPTFNVEDIIEQVETISGAWLIEEGQLSQTTSLICFEFPETIPE